MARISDFKAFMIGGGARANQFLVNLTFPSFVGGGIVAGQEAQFLCKSAQLPASTLANIEIQYRGRPVNFAGERTFQPWGITVYNDTSFGIRNALEQWSNGIQALNATTGLVNPRDYQVDLSVSQLDRNGAILKTYKFVDAYPTQVGAIALDYDQGGQIEQFDVEFQYNYWESDTAQQGAFGVNTSINTPIGTFPITL
jgi:hypothetical protein